MLEFLPFIPTQQNLDSLTTFPGTLGDGTTAPEANRVRLLAKLQQNVQWLADSIDAASLQSSLCLADEMLSSGSASSIVKSKECLRLYEIVSLTAKVSRSFRRVQLNTV